MWIVDIICSRYATYNTPWLSILKLVPPYCAFRYGITDIVRKIYDLPIDIFRKKALLVFEMYVRHIIHLGKGKFVDLFTMSFSSVYKVIPILYIRFGFD